MNTVILNASEFSKTFWIEAKKIDVNEQYRYHLSSTTHHDASLNISKLKEALQNTVNNNYNLRSTFKIESDILKQIIVSSLKVKLLTFVANNNEQLALILKENTVKAFDLENGPLFRFVLIESKFKNSYTFLTIFHHIIVDGLRYVDLLEEIQLNYLSGTSINNYDNDKISELTHYLKWEANKIKCINAASIIKEVETYPKSLGLIYDRPSVNSTQNVIVKFDRICGKLYEKLREYCSKNSYSVFNVLKTVWSTLICLYANQEEIVVTYPFDTRKEAYLKTIL